MKKKYYFYSVWESICYIIASLFLGALSILCLLADEIHFGVLSIAFFFVICMLIVLFWGIVSLSMRIQIDFENKELYIRQPYFVRRIKFKDVLSIEIIDYNEVAFDFIIRTKNYTKKMAYARYYKKRPSQEIASRLNELKKDLIRISDEV